MKKYLFFALSLLIVGFGRPTVAPTLGLLSFFGGFALFFCSVEGVSGRKRALYSLVWFTLVQLIQLYWFVSHPYNYIYPVWLFFSLLWGGQFALLALCVPREGEIPWRDRFGIAGLWVLFEWMRLFFLSGFTWNPSGLAPTGFFAFLHLTAFIGVFGLSFFGMLLNMTVLSEWRGGRFRAAPLLAALLFLIGEGHYLYRDAESRKDDRTMTAALMQTAFPVEEILSFKSVKEMFSYIEGEWKEIYSHLKQGIHEKVDLILMPELIVPYGTYMPLFSLSSIQEKVISELGEGGGEAMAPLEWPYAFEEKGEWKVTNGFLAQTLANYFLTDLVVGFEDAEQTEAGIVEHFNAALLFQPNQKEPKGRYEKRVLVPMGEYIPFTFCRELCKSYGVAGSYTAGKEAKALQGTLCRYGLSICYEETYGALMKENKGAGAEVLCNLTSDVWYPNSLLPEEHLAHARPRSVEMGLPLLRACNTGVTTAIDSLGRTVATLEGEWTRGVLVATVPLYSYPTLYSFFGDMPILILSLIALLMFAPKLLKSINCKPLEHKH